ncbi:MAG TPA: phage tail protein [Nitrospirales bacterium]
MKKTDIDAAAAFQFPSRRDFLRTMGLLTGGALVYGSPLLSLAVESVKDMRFIAGKFGLELDGAFAGFLLSADGGSGVGEVITTRSGGELIPRKQLGAVKYENIILTCGLGMSKAFYGWIKDTTDSKPLPKNGAILVLDFDYKERSRMTFQQGLLSEIAFPALDAASKDAAKMTIKIAPQSTRLTGPAPSATGIAKPDLSKTKAWHTSNFRLRIQGLEDACTRINKIEPLVVKQTIQSISSGDKRSPASLPGPLEFSNLVITLPELDAGPFYKWYDDFAIKGNQGDDKERQGVLELLDPTLKEVLLSVTLHHLGIFNFAPEKMEASSEKIRLVKAEMYCEAIQLT